MMKLPNLINFFLVLAITQSCCFSCGDGDNGEGEIIDETAVVTPIGDIYEKLSQVKAGPPYSMEIVTSHRELNNNDHVEVTEGGKAVLDFNGNINITLYNNTQLGGVIAELDPNTSPRIAARLERGGIFGEVITPGTELDISVIIGTQISVVGTRFFIVYNEENGYLTIGKFDGKLSYQVPGKSSMSLGNQRMVDINGEGTSTYFDIPFSQETFDRYASDLRSPVDGLNRLREDNQIPLPGESLPTKTPTSTRTPTKTVTPTHTPTQTFTPTPIPPMGEIWLNGGCNQQYDAGIGVQILTQINQDGIVTILFGNEKIKNFIDVMGNTIYNFDWRIPDTYGSNDLILSFYDAKHDYWYELGRCSITVWDSTPPPAPILYGPGEAYLDSPLYPPVVEGTVTLSWSAVYDSGGLYPYLVVIDSCNYDFSVCEHFKSVETTMTILTLTNEIDYTCRYRWTVFAIDSSGNYSNMPDPLYFSHCKPIE